MISAALFLLFAGACPAGVDASACAAVDACVARVYRPRAAGEGVTEGEAALASSLAAYRTCALEAQSLAVGRARALVVVSSTPAAALCLGPPLTVAPAAACVTERPWAVDVLSHGGACAVCGGAIALGAWAACR